MGRRKKQTKARAITVDNRSDSSTSSSGNTGIETDISNTSDDSNNDHATFFKSPESFQRILTIDPKLVADNDNDYALFTPSFRQSLLVSMVFVLGIYTGVAYVGWVQDKYGFGVDPVLERQYLPYGPTTEAYVRACTRNATTLLPTTTTKVVQRKSIRLNRDNPRPQTPVLSTLFGLEYGHIVSTQQAVVESTSASTQQAVVPPPPSRQVQVSPDWYRLASTPAVSLNPLQVTMIQEVGAQVRTTVPNWNQRAALVSWGGGSHNMGNPEANWWFPGDINNATSAVSHELSTLDGGHLLYAYLHIMRWDPHPHFPFRLCGEQGCPPERAIAHSLEWREKYRPWLAPPSVLAENAKGYCYHRGFSPAVGDTEKHATVWLRLGHQVQNDLAFFRGILHSADRAIADALSNSQGETGKFNVVMDCAGFSLSNTPTIAALKQGVTMLQDHYPNRLGMIFLVHLSRPGQAFLNIVLRLITKEVRDKVKILPNHDQAKSLAILRSVVEEHSIPDWLGGTDTYRFDVDEYYPPHHRCTEEEAQEFLTTMPYHAK